MKRGTLLLTLVIAAFGAACSSGGSSTLPPPPPVGFSNSSLKGQYAFTMTGQTNADINGSIIARIGTFTADGNGGITAGLELVSTPTNGLQELQFTPATNAYQVSQDGRAAISLTNITGIVSFSITMISTGKGYISQTDGLTTTSGTFELQDASAFSLSGINGSFVFDTSGFDASGAFDSIVGQFTLNAGTVEGGGVFDENNNAVASNPQTILANSYFLDATFGTTAGLGQLKFNNFIYDFIIVSGKKLFLIEVPSSGQFPMTIGTATAQTSPPTTDAAFTGSFVFLTSGVGTTTADFKVARFTADGNKGLNSIAMDEKLVGSSVTAIPSGANSLSAMTYAVDASFPGSGRVTVSFLDSINKQPYQFIAYMASGTQGVIQDNSKGIVGDGTILAQTGAPFSNSSIAADYAFNWTGTSQNNTTAVIAEEDFVGQANVTNASSSNVTGAMDFSELNLVDPVKAGIHNSSLTGALTVAGDGTTSSGNRSNFQVNATNPSGGPSTTFNFNLYPVNTSTMFVVSTDKDHSSGGVFTKQITPP